MAKTAVTRQPPELLISRENKMRPTAEEVMEEKAVIKDAAVEADASTTHPTHHTSETSREKLTILARC